MSAADVLETLYLLLITHGTLQYIHCDNGPEFAIKVFQNRLTNAIIKPIRIYSARHAKTALMRDLTGYSGERSWTKSGLYDKTSPNGHQCVGEKVQSHLPSPNP